LFDRHPYRVISVFAALLCTDRIIVNAAIESLRPAVAGNEPAAT